MQGLYNAYYKQVYFNLTGSFKLRELKLIRSIPAHKIYSNFARISEIFEKSMEIFRPEIFWHGTADFL